jgi:thiosulfate dehydrogenase [quinone] large subunit
MLGVLLVLAWKTAGWWGLDRLALPVLGTPWAPGYIFQSDDGHPAPLKQPGQA